MGAATELMPDWKQWEGETVDGKFPLIRFLGAGERSAVYRTQVDSGDAAIKLVLVRGEDAQSLTGRWERASHLEHPHLIKILSIGTWTKSESTIAYTVTEYADENLAQVLNERALESNEILAMLPPITAAMTFLHGQGLVLGSLKPSNIYSVQETLKISSDAVCNGDAFTDLRAFAATIAESLTRKPTAFVNGADTSIVKSLPEPFREITKNCLGENGRPSLSAAELSNWHPSLSAAAPISKEAISAETTVAAPRTKLHRPHLTSIVIASGLILVVVIIVGTFLRNREEKLLPSVSESLRRPEPAAAVSQPVLQQPESQPEVQAPAPQKTGRQKRSARAKSTEAAPTAPHKVAGEPSLRPAVSAGQGEVVSQVLPEIPEKDRRTITGKATVVIKVAVDPSGKVTNAELQPGGSRYFGQLATRAAREWQFAPANGSATRERLLRFQITRTDTKVILGK